MKRKVLTTIAVLAACISVHAQDSRRYIKDQIEEWGSCRNVAITLTGGDIALNHTNAYAYSSIPQDLADAIDGLHADGEYIDDIQLTEACSWLILYGKNGCLWYGIPEDLENTLAKYSDNDEIVTSVTFNDNGDWIVISQDYISASDTSLYDFIEEGINKYGQLWAAHMTNDGLVLCYENGYRFRGNVPQTLRDKLSETGIDVFRIKFLSDGTYFIADQEGTYAYYM